MWIVQVSGYHLGRKWTEKYTFKTKSEAYLFKSEQKKQAEIYQLEVYQ